MELSTADGALRTLRLRPKAPEGAVGVCETLLRLLERPADGPAPAGDDDDDAQQPHGQQQQVEDALTALVGFGEERWEPLAVAAAVTRDLVQRHVDAVGRAGPESKPRAFPFSANFLTTVVRPLVRAHLEHWEPRVRMSLAKLVGALAGHDLAWVSREFTPLIVDSVLCNLTRSPDFEETGIDEDMDDNISVNGMESPTNSSRGTPRTPSTPHRLDDVSGWKALESSLSALKYMVRGGGAAFLTTTDDKGAFAYLTPELQELMTTKSVFHINRHVRVVGLDTISALCDVAPVGFLDAHRRDLCDPLAKCIVRGMQDNWSQVRYAASIATRAFLMRLQENAREEYFAALVPRLCLNRYYVAERVQKHSQETWRLLMGDRGREIVARYAREIVDYYVEMTSHCVREAACHCIAELATKVDKAAIRPHVPRLLDALLYSFRDTSWLVRDAACLASSQFVVGFPDESREVLEELYGLWTDHLSDEIWSVREDAAIALGNVVRAYGPEALTRVTAIAEDFIVRAKAQPAMCQHEFDELMRSEKKHSSKQAFSCCSFEPTTDARHEHHEKQPWEHTDGAIYLVRELCGVAPEVGVRLLPAVADVAILRHFPQTATLQETVWKQLPVMCERLGKRVFKQYLELFLDPLTFTLQGSHRLARFAARDCVAQLSKQIGPNIFLGRLQANPSWVETIAPVVPVTPGLA